MYIVVRRACCLDEKYKHEHCRMERNDACNLICLYLRQIKNCRMFLYKIGYEKSLCHASLALK
jgi:hypothetical protein